MTDLDIKKTKLKFEFQQFIVILVFVFWLWTAWASLNAKQMQIIDKLDVVAKFQETRVVSDDTKHSVIDTTFAWLVPTVHTLAKRAWME